MIPTFDVRGFMAELGDALRPIAAKTGAQASMVVSRVRQLEADMIATLEAIKTEEDPERRANLQVDLETILPARRDFILSAAESLAGTSAHAALEASLDVAVRVGIALGRALILG